MNCGSVGPPGGQSATGPKQGVWLINNTALGMFLALVQRWHDPCLTSKIRAHDGWHASC